MSSQYEQLAADALKLPGRERVRLAQQLVSTLEEDVEAETGLELETDVLWFAEAERRLEELRSGNVQGISA
jgi:hypothetical protein